MTHRLYAVWLLIGIALTVSTLFRTPPVTASTITTTCYGASCNGVQLDTTTCRNDAVIVAQTTYLWRYYSPTCNAYYAIIGTPLPAYATAWMEANETATRTTSASPYEYGAISRMWDSGRACGRDSSYGTRCI